MTHYLRIFQSAVDPADVDDVRRLFIDDVQPAFLSRPGCIAMELVINTEKNAGGLVDGAAISRWESLDAMDAALQSREIREALVRILQLLRQEPLSRVFEVLVS